MSAPHTYIVQLPFPSMAAPHPLLAAYYRDYEKRFVAEFPKFFVPHDALWELPLWTAHLAGILKTLGIAAELLDLSSCPAAFEPCLERALQATRPGDTLHFSPLAQNFDLAIAVSRGLQAEGRTTVFGGNMAPLASSGDASFIYLGPASPDGLAMLLAGTSDAQATCKQVPQRASVGWVPDYRILRGYRRKVPLLRINASHGCLHACAFCGDVWSQKLHVVERTALEAELIQLEEFFPETDFIYIGDKTFGQSKEAVANLFDVLERRRRKQYQLIVQTHLLQVTDDLIEAMQRLGVVIVELGLETADPRLLVESRKTSNNMSRWQWAIQRLRSAGIRVILNILGGLPKERLGSHEMTIDFMHTFSKDVWLYNLYNFVPYPLTPYFSVLRSRIFDWSFSNWREDAPPVFEPYYQSVEASWGLFLEKVQEAHAAIR